MAKDLVAVRNTDAADDGRALTAVQFGQLAEVPTELEWLANITNPKTRRAYKIDVGEFSAFASLRHPTEFRVVTRAHVIAWRKHLESRKLADSTIRRKLSALSALFDYLCEHNAVAGNPVDGVKRPSANANEGSTPALGDAQARKLLDAPPENTLRGVCDRVILATLLYHGIRCEELCRLRLRDLQSRYFRLTTSPIRMTVAFLTPHEFGERVRVNLLFTLRKLASRDDGETLGVLVGGRRGNSLQKGHSVCRVSVGVRQQFADSAL
jgi:integrase